MVQIICPTNPAGRSTKDTKCRNSLYRVKEGDVFIVPKHHPMTQISFNNDSLVFVGFSTNARDNYPQFLAGERSVLQEIDKEILKEAFNAPNSTVVKQLLSSQRDAIILGCTSCAEGLVKKAEKERRQEEKRQREKEERRREKEEEREEEERQREEEEEEERKREEEKERKEEEEEERQREEEQRRLKEEERKREEEESRRREEQEEKERFRREKKARRREEREARRREEEEERRREEEEEEGEEWLKLRAW